VSQPNLDYTLEKNNNLEHTFVYVAVLNQEFARIPEIIARNCKQLSAFFDHLSYSNKLLCNRT